MLRINKSIVTFKRKKKVSQHPLPNNADSEIRVG
jgi:hypothetical protein